MSAVAAEPFTARLSFGRQLTIEPFRREIGTPKAPEGVILVLDDRQAEDPSFRIVDSALLRNRKAQAEVLAAICDFAKAHPSERGWDRSVRSMLVEWKLHNVCYRMGIFRENARHVDLNNGAEHGGISYLFNKIKTLFQLFRRRCAARASAAKDEKKEE